MNFKRINNIAGWIVFLVASAVYVMTAEKNGSLWDCGEFVASCFKLQIPHPPGAPLFVILGRFFVILFGNDAATAAKAVNIMSALASGFTILFLFWTITHYARKLVNPIISTITGTQQISIIGAGVVGALAYTFSDSFWYSAVEGEVYALSSFFTALVFWAMVKWEQAVDADSATEGTSAGHFNADRWIVFIFFMMGLSIGVHLLNLLTIPAIAMIYYFKRYKVTRNGTIMAFLVGCIITGVSQKAVIQYTIKGAGAFDRLFVNSFGLPFFSGFAMFFILMAVLIFIGIRIAQKKGWYFLRLGLWSFTFIMIGYSSYLTTMIRSSADPGVDMYNVDNPMSLVGYLGREQYGDFPLVYGQVFTVQNRNIERKEGAMRYQKSKNQGKYIELGRSQDESYAADDMMFFPRVWDRSNDQQHANYYADYLGIGVNNDPKANDPDTGPYERRPTFGDNIKFFVGYQTYWMYLRYFLWNFAGKQNDVQGVSAGNVRDGNWKTGISAVDNLLYGDQSKLPETIRDNKANNKLFALPLILGLIGLFFQYYRNRRDFIVTGLLFFFTGFAIVLYLNQAGNQPRERDYAYVGSFYAFAIWIGLAIPALVELAARQNKKLLQKIAISAGIIYFIGAASATVASGDFNGFLGIVLLGAFATAITFGLYYLLVALKAEKTMASVALAIGLLVTVWMGVQEWDDHDRSNKTTAPDLAKDYLESCAPNAILFSFGDNDTYPLWYAQEVQGVRPDIRVINYSLLGIDWYINQLRYKVNNSDAMDVIWSTDQIEGDKLNYAFTDQRPGFTGFTDLYTVLKDWVGTNDPKKMYNTGEEPIPIMPTSNFSIPVDKEFVRKNGTVMPNDTAIVDSVKFSISRNVLMKNDLAVLAVIAANKWNRPIYFTSKFDELNFQNYLRRDGMTYRLVPLLNQDVNTDWAFDKLMNKFAFGSAEKKGVYFDEENRRHLNSIRQTYADVAMALSAQGKNDSARKSLDKVDKMMLQSNMPYGLVSRYNMHNQTSLMLLQAAYQAGDKELVDKISKAVRKELTEEVAYFEAIGERRAERMSYEFQRSQNLLQMMNQMEAMFKQRDEMERGQQIQTNPDTAPADGTKKDTQGK
jgi:hypothetical protein